MAISLAVSHREVDSNAVEVSPGHIGTGQDPNLGAGVVTSAGLAGFGAFVQSWGLIFLVDDGGLHVGTLHRRCEGLGEKAGARKEGDEGDDVDVHFEADLAVVLEAIVYCQTV